MVDSQVGWDTRHSCSRVALILILRQKSKSIVSNKLWCPFIPGDQCPWFLCINMFGNQLWSREGGRKACFHAGKRLRTRFHMLQESHKSIAGRCGLLRESSEKKGVWKGWLNSMISPDFSGLFYHAMTTCIRHFLFFFSELQRVLKYLPLKLTLRNPYF